MTKFIAITAVALVEAGSMSIISGIGNTATEALSEAVSNTNADEADFDVLTASDRLADYVERYGADLDLEWAVVDGVADLMNEEV